MRPCLERAPLPLHEGRVNSPLPVAEGQCTGFISDFDLRKSARYPEKGELELAHLDVSDLVREVAGLVRSQASHSGLPTVREDST